MDKIKMPICPIMQAHTGEIEIHCMGSGCAWWDADPGMECCSVFSIHLELNNLRGEMRRNGSKK